MIAHVAAAHEQRGRVVLRITSAQPSTVALDAAIRIAQGFQSEIECLFVEDADLLALAEFPFAREISRTGRHVRGFDRATLEEEFKVACRIAERMITGRAMRAEVPVRVKIVRDEPDNALATSCAECGPWNVCALGEPLAMTSGTALQALFDHVHDMTGLVVVGPAAIRTHGPIVVVAEEAGQLQPMLRAAERLVGDIGREVVLALLTDSGEQSRLLDAQARLLLDPGTSPVRLVALNGALGDPRVLAEQLRRLQAGFVIAAFGGTLVPRDGDLRPLAAALECPLFLMR